jgi:hypothetical protein
MMVHCCLPELFIYQEALPVFAKGYALSIDWDSVSVVQQNPVSCASSNLDVFNSVKRRMPACINQGELRGAFVKLAVPGAQ